MVAAEEAKQRELTLLMLSRDQQRLDRVSFPLLRAGVTVCPTEDIAPRLGLRYATADAYSSEWQPAARQVLGLGDEPTVTSVAAGSPAAAAGLQVGDRLLAVDDVPLPAGQAGADQLTSSLLAVGKVSSVEIALERQGVEINLDLGSAPDACNYAVVVSTEIGMNAYADGSNIVIGTEMMRFATDEELSVVIGHEMAHNSLRHIDRDRSKALSGGALGDIPQATRGVTSGGVYPQQFAGVGAFAFSQDLEREADHVGLYVMANAGANVSSAPTFWRHMAIANPDRIAFASLHPTTAERLLRLDETVSEIEKKRLAGLPLMPEYSQQPDYLGDQLPASTEAVAGEEEGRGVGPRGTEGPESDLAAVERSEQGSDPPGRTQAAVPVALGNRIVSGGAEAGSGTVLQSSTPLESGAGPESGAVPEPSVATPARNATSVAAALDDAVHEWFGLLAREAFSEAFEAADALGSPESLEYWWREVRGESGRPTSVQTLQIRTSGEQFIADVLVTFDEGPDSNIEIAISRGEEIIGWRAVPRSR